jgi:hypothetical protein
VVHGFCKATKGIVSGGSCFLLLRVDKSHRNGALIFARGPRSGTDRGRGEILAGKMSREREVIV